ncbi:mannosyl-oligosaccharide 1,2-alpha-mannosidase [Aureococcus anophagefferens]|nr:mannosyl-oligosaccharide 1,2-alpha-mannosidase [Aureococcus anophagefferens]
MGRHSSSTLPVSPLAALIGIATLTWMAVVMTTPAELATDRQALRGLREARNGTREMEKLRKAMAQLHEGIDAAAQRPAAPAAPPPPPAAAAAPAARRLQRGVDISGDGADATDGVKPGVVACVPRARAAPPPLEAPASTATCEFAAGLDVAGQDLRDGPALVGATEATCCEACRADAGCVAAVLSAPGDDPPRACWLKRSAEPAAAKDGVALCRPLPRRTPAPPPPPAVAEVRLRAGAPDAPTDAAELARRRAAIAAAVKHAGFDMAVTLVDSLDTLWIVGLKEEFKEARDFVATEAFGKKLRSPPSSASIFETTIRVLGGLLGAYEVSRDKIFVTRALDIGNVIHGKLDKRSGLELIYLARVSGDPKFLKTARLFYDHIKRAARASSRASTRTDEDRARTREAEAHGPERDGHEGVLRPEAAEGWWYLSILPGLDHMRDKYRAWSWQSFQAIDDLLRAPFGHASMRDVSKPRASASANRLDRMESFWIAETLTYLYLIQEETPSFPLDAYVFNTEAHPFSIHTF